MDLGDFARQLPIGYLLMPIVFGALYIGVMLYILQRARRRRRQREGNTGVLEGVPTPNSLSGKPPGGRLARLPMGDFLRGQLPEHNMTPASWTVPAELRGMPEPDLDMLATPVLMTESTNVQTNNQTDGVQAVADPIVVHAQDYVPADEQRVEIAPAEELEETMTHIASDSSTASADNTPMRQTELPGDAVEVMRVYRDLSDGRLIVEMGGQRYRSLGEVRNPDLVRRFTALVRDLAAMVNAGSGRALQNVSESTASVPPPDNSAGGMKARIGLLTREPEAPKPNIMKGFAKTALGQTTSAQNDSPTGIASAVEDFLQFKLSSTPQFATRSIHISTAHDHSIRIEVDGHYYEAIGEVVDADVRDFLFNMMREWEARH